MAILTLEQIIETKESELNEIVLDELSNNKGDD